MNRIASSIFVLAVFRTPSPCRMIAHKPPFTDGENGAALPADIWCWHA